MVEKEPGFWHEVRVPLLWFGLCLGSRYNSLRLGAKGERERKSALIGADPQKGVVSRFCQYRIRCEGAASMGRKWCRVACCPGSCGEFGVLFPRADAAGLRCFARCAGWEGWRGREWGVLGRACWGAGRCARERLWRGELRGRRFSAGFMRSKHREHWRLTVECWTRCQLDSATFWDADGDNLIHCIRLRVRGLVPIGERSRRLRLGVKLLCRNGFRIPNCSDLTLSG